MSKSKDHFFAWGKDYPKTQDDMIKPQGPTLNGEPILRGPGLCVFCGKPSDMEYHFECKAIADEFMHNSIYATTSEEEE